MRKRSEPHTFEQRLAEQRLRLEREASELPDGELRDALAWRIEQLQRAADINDWLKRGNGVSRKPRVAAEHDPEKWMPVFRKDHAQLKS